MSETLTLPTTEKIRVRYGETDAMGHAYYGSYLLWMEQARGAWCRARGFHYRELEERGIFLPVVEVNIRYRAEIKYDEVIAVTTWVSEIKRASMRFDYIIHREDGVASTEAYSWHVTMGEHRKAVTIPADIRELLARNPETISAS